MDDIAAAPPSDGALPVERVVVRRHRRPWWQRLLIELAALLVGLLLLAGVALVVIDTAPGHRFIVDRINRLEIESGLTIHVGRIDGSILGETRLKDVRLGDGQGTFLSSPEIDLDWAPLAWLYNSLVIDRVHAGKVRLERLPRLKPSGKAGPILPGFDLHIGQLTIDRLEVGAKVSGVERVGKVAGSAEIRAGRAMVQLDGALVGGDRVHINLDSQPDRDKFDLAVKASAPRDGLLPALIGVKASLTLDISGRGGWTQWRGAAAGTLDGRKVIGLALAAESGRYRLEGRVVTAGLVGPKLRALTAPVVALKGVATLKDRLLDGQLSATSAAVHAVVRGAVDLGANRYRAVRLGVDLAQPRTLLNSMQGRAIRLVWTLDGPFASADYAYRLSAADLSFDTTRFTNVRAEGRGQVTPWPMRVPIRLQAGAVAGLGDVAGGILRNLSIEGVLALTPQNLRGDRLAVKSDKLSGQMSLLVDFATGRFDVTLSGGLKRFLIPGLGIVDVTTDLHVVPGANGQARVVGKGEAWVRRLDNSFFASLTGGLPHLTTDLERGADGVLRFSNLQLYSPRLRLSGSGYRRADGSFHLDLAGRQASYGPVKVQLDGPIDRPRVELLLTSPGLGLGIGQLRLSLVPSAAGFDYSASGASQLGPFTSRGQILLPRGADTVIAIAALDVAGTHASGRLVSRGGALDGLLTLAGGGIDGTLALSPASGGQKVEAHLALTNANFSGPPAIHVTAGRVDGTALIANGTTSLDGVINASGVKYGSMTLARLVANGHLVNGAGQVRAALSGQRGQAFTFNGVADIAPGRISVSGAGSIDRRAIELAGPAVLTPQGDGWTLAPVTVRFGGGRATVSGHSGAHPAIHASIAAMPVELLDIFYPNLGLGGVASGTVDLSLGNDRNGRIDLRVRRLTRSGLVLASHPIDVGLAAVIADGRVAMRAVAMADGKIIGRAQGRFAPLGPGPLPAALMQAPMLVQLRYAGPADTLWRLSGVELFDLSGPVAVGADISGRLVDPVIRGSVRASGARLESAVTGTVIQNLNAAGTFDGSRLLLSQLGGTTAGGGTIAGRGTVDFSGGVPALDLAFDTVKAKLLDRDDIAAAVTGPLKVRSDGRSGTISGTLHLDSGRFTLGKASAAAAVPTLKVREVGGSDDDVIEVAQLKPWGLSVKLDGGPLTVVGLGIDSRWRTNLAIGGDISAPRLTGRADLIRGSYEFAGREFALDRGVIRFLGESPPDPTLDIHATATVQSVNAAVTVTGTGLNPQIAFTSTPALPQDELLARILFGTSITNLSAPEALQLASAVAALRSGGGGLDPINAVRRAIGLDRLRIVPADIASGQKTALSAGKYLGKKLFVEVITDGQGYSATRIEYQITRWLSLLSSVSTVGRTSANVRVQKDY